MDSLLLIFAVQIFILHSSQNIRHNKQKGRNVKEIVIPKENAVFWMDGDGAWHNEHGRFEHPKIIRHFHTSIQRDENGYHLCQEREGIREKAYFPYEETALFVFQVIQGSPVQLVLNTEKIIRLNPEELYTANDLLYIQRGDELIKFSQKALMAFAPLLDETDGQLFLCLDGERYSLRELE